VYSYSLDFICLDPLGSTNYGKLTNIQLNVEVENDLSVCGVPANQTLAGVGYAAGTSTTSNEQGIMGGQSNSGVFNMGHASMVDTLYLTNNCSSSNGFDNTVLGASLNAYCEVPYYLVLTAINNNIIRISGGALGFPVL